MSTIEMHTTVESELDRKLEEIIGKMVDGTATEGDRREYQMLSVRRGRLMSPSPAPARPRTHVFHLPSKVKVW
ncbi:MAG: hypothetical protein K0S00_3884 [Xanthobacteraceae bacterium]|jgi:hypothetical protein|nr:hypothetical protein [Xanthobacteraceae bacterium]